MSPTLPGFVAVLLLSLACSRRAPALRPVVALFTAWSILDAVTGPLWLRAGVLVAWPGAAVACAAWGLRIERKGAVVEVGADVEDGIAIGAPKGVVESRGVREAEHEGREVFHPRTIPYLVAILYLLAGIASALTYRAHLHACYHVALPLSRALPVALAALALVTGRLPRTWAARAAVAPAAGLAFGVVIGVWSLLPSGLESVREQWSRLAHAETWLTLAITAGCVVMARYRAKPDGGA